jgi:hypothetical protein
MSKKLGSGISRVNTVPCSKIRNSTITPDARCRLVEQKVSLRIELGHVAAAQRQDAAARHVWMRADDRGNRAQPHFSGKHLFAFGRLGDDRPGRR